jgi:hypothetical protein
MVITCQPEIEIATPTCTKDFRGRRRDVEVDQTI